MGEYDRQVATALRLLAKKGRTVTYRRLANGVAPSDTPWKDPGQVAQDVTVSIVFLPASMGNTARQSPVTKGYSQEGPQQFNVPRKLKVAYMGDVGFEPSLKDVIVVAGVEHRIKSCDTLDPNGQTIIHQLQLEV